MTARSFERGISDYTGKGKEDQPDEWNQPSTYLQQSVLQC